MAPVATPDDPAAMLRAFAALHGLPMLDVDAIEKRAAAATAGPWRRCGANVERPEGCRCGLVWSIPADTTVADVNISAAADAPAEIPQPERHRNGLFIAHAREDVPALVAEVRRLRALVAATDALRIADTHVANIALGLLGDVSGEERARAVEVAHAALQAFYAAGGEL